MACYFQNIKIVEGNAFALLLPLVARYYTIEGRPNDEDIDCTQLENCKVMIGSTEYAATLTTEGVVIRDEGTLARGTYDIVLTATYQGYALRADWFEGVTIVKYNHQSNAEQYIQGSPIVMRPAFCIMALGDTELQNLKEQLQQKIAETEQAKEAYEQAKADYDAKAEALDDVAKQSTLTSGVQTLSNKIDNINIDTSDLAKQGTNPDATNTAILTAAQNAGADSQAVAQSYDILQAKGVPIPEHTTDRTAQNLPATIDQINPAFVGEAILSGATVNNTQTSNPIFNGRGFIYTGPDMYKFNWMRNYNYIHSLRCTPDTNNFDLMFQHTVCDRVDISTLDMTGALNAGRIFYGATIKKLDMHGLNFAIATDLHQMFFALTDARWIDMSGTKVCLSLQNFTSFWGDFHSPLLTTLVGDHTIEEVVNNNICIFEGFALSSPDSNGWNMCTNINRASLRAIINGLADMTGQSTLNLIIGANNIAKLTADDIAVATNKNWTLA